MLFTVNRHKLLINLIKHTCLSFLHESYNIRVFLYRKLCYLVCNMILDTHLNNFQICVNKKTLTSINHPNFKVIQKNNSSIKQSVKFKQCA